MPMVLNKGIWQVMNIFENISIQNLRENGGTLGLTFYQMLGILNKHNKTGDVYYVYNEDYKIVGYTLIHSDKRKEAHIGHIAIDPEHQKKGYGTYMVNKLMKKFDYITADVMFDNYKSEAFFKKLGFEFTPEYEKDRWNIKWRKNK